MGQRRFYGGQPAARRAGAGMNRKSVDADVYAAQVGQEIGVSGWHELDQARIDGFAGVTGDFQFIHVAPDRAAETEYGGTIAHGFLSLSLLSCMAAQALPVIAGQKFEVNYGFNRVRFLAPVRAGRRVRGRFVLAALDKRRPGECLATFGVTIDIEGEAKPALIAEWLVLSLIGDVTPDVAGAPQYSRT